MGQVVHSRRTRFWLPPTDELERNQRAGFRHLWGVSEGYEIHDQVLRPVGGLRRWYAPAVNRDLLPEFALVRDEKSLLRFSRQFGLLGYSVLVPPAKRCGGDPVGWALRHARAVSAVIRILELLPDRGWLKKKLPTVLRQAGIQLFTPKEVAYRFPEIIRTPGAWAPMGSWPQDPTVTAYAAIAKIINPPLRGLHYELARVQNTAAPQDPPGLYLRFRALIELIYWKLAANLREGYQWRSCRGCAKIFLVEEPHQHYCSPRCQNTSMKRRQRQRRREKLLQGKKSRRRMRP